MNNVVLATWEFTASQAQHAYVIPDGCRDLIVRERPSCAPEVILTALDDRPRTVHVADGERLRGVRFRPGVHLDERLLRTTCSPAMLDLDVRAVDGISVPDVRVQEALQSIAAAEGALPTVARDLGVTARTLQRLVSERTGRPPIYWRRLARIRIAGRALAGGESIADVAVSHGFSDQAHLTRESRHWLGTTPRQLAAGAPAARMLADAGYG